MLESDYITGTKSHGEMDHLIELLIEANKLCLHRLLELDHLIELLIAFTVCLMLGCREEGEQSGLLWCLRIENSLSFAFINSMKSWVALPSYQTSNTIRV